MNMGLSPDTNAILLLTAPLIIGKSKPSVRPLNSAEYGKLARRLSECGRQPADLLQPGADDVLRECGPGFDCDRISQLLERGLLLSQAWEGWQARTIWVMSRADPDYPQRYKQLPGRYRPPILYGCGDKALLQNGGLAVVGSRKISDELVEYTEGVGRLAAEAQFTVVSGGALGVDQASVQGVLSNGGTAAVVLPGSLEKETMARKNRNALMDGSLVLLSPFDPRAGWSVGQAMGRNKLIYGLSNVALIVESSYNEGGTWPGAVEQLDKLRFVPVYTRSIGPSSKGLDALRSKGALSWAEPKTVEEFRKAMAGDLTLHQAEAPKQPALFSSNAAAIEPCDNEEQAVPATPAAESNYVANKSAADALIAQAEHLLSYLDAPINDTVVAEYLKIPKTLAKNWLKRLEQDGKYRRLKNPVRYERIHV